MFATLTCVARRIAWTAAALALVACSAHASSSALVERVGLDLPTSGADAAFGIPARNAAVLAIEEARASPAFAGVSLELDERDDTVQGIHDPAAGVQNLKAFAADPAVLVAVGPLDSNIAEADLPVAAASGLALISPSVTNDAVTTGASARDLRAKNGGRTTFFRDCTTDSRLGLAAARLARARGVARVAIVDDDETYGRGLADVFDAEFRRNGGAVLAHEHAVPLQQDFKAMLTALGALRPDALFFGGATGTGGGLLRKQMGDVGLGRLPFYGGDGIADDEFVKIAGPLADGTFFTLASPDLDRLPAARRFAVDYRQRWHAEPGAFSANTYVAMQLALDAMARARSSVAAGTPSREDVRRALALTSRETAIGHVAFDADGDATSPVLSLYAFAGGRRRFVREIALGAPRLETDEHLPAPVASR